MKTIGIFHYADVNNYGDVLFPRIISHEIRKRIACNFKYFACTEDLCLPLHSTMINFQEMTRTCDVAIIAGGEIVHRHDDMLRKIYASFSLTCIERPTDLVFGLSKLDIKYKAWVALGIPPVSEIAITDIRDALDNLSHFSVRGSQSRAIIREINPNAEVQVVPDLGWLIPELAAAEAWPMIDPDVPEVYIAAQVLPGTLRTIDAQQIADALSRLGDSVSAAIMLMPITDCWGDDEPLSRVYDASKGRFILQPRLPFEKRGSLLMGAQGFIGQSMHGAITAMAAGKPAVVVPPQGPAQKFKELFNDMGMDGLYSDWNIAVTALQFNLKAETSRFSDEAAIASKRLGAYLDALAEEIEQASSA
jgi:polysaccharide pyruvyl transferase WcaK-like protein